MMALPSPCREGKGKTTVESMRSAWQTVGKPAAVDLHGSFFLKEQLAGFGSGDDLRVLREEALPLHLLQQRHALRPAGGRFLGRCRPLAMILLSATAQKAKLRHIMRLIAEGDCYGHNAVFSEDPGGGFQAFSQVVGSSSP